tara:strand:- start:269 stop:403 length:135 start_codon:yes stop_codon:yes gene_type:complete
MGDIDPYMAKTFNQSIAKITEKILSPLDILVRNIHFKSFFFAVE